MKPITCEKCGTELLFATDSNKEEIAIFLTVCPCGHTTSNSFFGYPKLAGNETYYFEFVDENKVVCKPRITYKRPIK